MPKNPKTGEKRPSDLNRLAGVIVAAVTRGDVTWTRSADSKKRKAGQAGAKARATTLGSQERKKIASKAAKARWKS